MVVVRDIDQQLHLDSLIYAQIALSAIDSREHDSSIWPGGFSNVIKERKIFNVSRDQAI